VVHGYTSTPSVGRRTPSDTAISRRVAALGSPRTRQNKIQFEPYETSDGYYTTRGD